MKVTLAHCTIPPKWALILLLSIDSFSSLPLPLQPESSRHSSSHRSSHHSSHHSSHRHRPSSQHPHLGRPSSAGASSGSSGGGSSGRSKSSSSRPPGDEVYVGKYKLLKTIGKGNFAKVKLARHMPTGQEVS